MTKIDATYLAHLKTLDQNATPGPWWFDPQDKDPLAADCGAFEPDICDFGQNESYDQLAGSPPSPEDAAFIAESRTAIPALIAEVERLRDLIHRAYTVEDDTGWLLREEVEAWGTGD